MIERMMMCDYENCRDAVPATDVAPDGWVYMKTRHQPFGLAKDSHFCNLTHASLHEFRVEQEEKRISEEQDSVEGELI